jgi:hypothetical protein
MEKFLPLENSLGVRMTAYTAAAGLMIAYGSALNAQVVYSGVRDSLVTSHLHPFELNLDGNDQVDFQLGIWLQSNGGFTYNNSAYIKGASSNSNRWIAVTGGTVHAFEEGEIISSTGSAFGAIFRSNDNGWNLGSYSSHSGSTFGNFPGAGDKFIALQFHINSDIHYGWVRINLNSVCDYMDIIDWAYESTPDKPIAAGILNVELSAPDSVREPFDVAINFSDTVSNFRQDSIIVVNGTVSGISGSDKSYKATIQPAAKGDIQIQLKEGAATYLTNIKSLQKQIKVYYDDTPIVSDVVNKTEPGEFKLFPVPATDILNVESNEPAVVSIFNIEGRTVLTEENVMNLKIDVSGFPRGMYLVQIKTVRNSYREKIVIQ